MSVQIDPKLCFVLMPMRAEFVELYEDLIRPAIGPAIANLAADIEREPVLLSDRH